MKLCQTNTQLGKHSTLVDAIYVGDKKTIEQLLTKVDVRFNNDELLRAATWVGDLETVKRLVKMGCQFSHNFILSDIDGDIAKFIARQPKIDHQLICALLHTTSCKEVIVTLTKHHPRKLFECLIYECAMANDLPCVHAFVKLVFPYIKGTLESVGSLLDALYANYKVALFLVPFVTFDKFSRIPHSDSPVIIPFLKLVLPYVKPIIIARVLGDCAEIGNTRLIKHLVKYYQVAPNSRGSYALRCALRFGYVDLLKLVLPYSNPDAHDTILDVFCTPDFLKTLRVALLFSKHLAKCDVLLRRAALL